MDFLIAMDPAVKCLLLLLVVAILFVTEKIPLAVTSIASAVCCWLLGLVPLKEVFLGLADSTVVLFGGMFVVGAAMFYTGLAQDIGARIVKVFGTSETKLMIGVMIIAAVMSAFLSNTGTTACTFRSSSASAKKQIFRHPVFSCLWHLLPASAVPAH